MEQYKTYCTPEQTKKAIGLGAPIKVCTCTEKDEIKEAKSISAKNGV